MGHLLLIQCYYRRKPEENPRCLIVKLEALFAHATDVKYNFSVTHIQLGVRSSSPT